MSEQHRLTIATRGRGSVEITGEIAGIVRAAAVGAGIAHIFVRHTSCGVAITENADLTVPFAGGRLLLGTWQGIYLFEHRTQGHRREIVVTLLA